MEGHEMIEWIVGSAVSGFVLGFVLNYLLRATLDRRNAGKEKGKAQTILEAAKKESETIKIQAELRAREIKEKAKSEIERESREKHKEFLKWKIGFKIAKII